MGDSIVRSASHSKFDTSFKLLTTLLNFFQTLSRQRMNHFRVRIRVLAFQIHSNSRVAKGRTRLSVDDVVVLPFREFGSARMIILDTKLATVLLGVVDTLKSVLRPFGGAYLSLTTSTCDTACAATTAVRVIATQTSWRHHWRTQFHFRIQRFRDLQRCPYCGVWREEENLFVRERVHVKIISFRTG